MTAAHCVIVGKKESFSVLAGATKKTNEGTEVKVSQIYVHNSFVDQRAQNDIAVIILKTSLKFNNKIQAIKLPKDDKDLKDGTEVVVSGWGVTEKHPSGIDKLQKVTVKIIDRKECRKLIGNSGPYQVDSGMICAGIPKTGGKDACQVRKRPNYIVYSKQNLLIL